MNNNRIAILNQSSPFSGPQIKESLDLALIMGSYEQKISLFFMGEGVRQLVADQQPTIIEQKDCLKTFSAFEFYDIEHIYACKYSLNERKLTTDFHIESVQVLPREQFKDKLYQHTTILRF